MKLAADMGRHSGRATPSLHDDPYRQFKTATGRPSTYPLPIPVQINSATSQCLADGVSLLAIFGPGSEELEESIDWIVVGDASDPSRFLCTTSHPDEPFDTVLSMAQTWESERGDSVQEVRL
jgi:hypothetical protein